MTTEIVFNLLTLLLGMFFLFAKVTGGVVFKLLARFGGLYIVTFSIIHLLKFGDII